MVKEELDLGIKCRACLVEQEQMHHLFTEFTENLTLAEILKSTTGFEVDEIEGFPNLLCENCAKILVDFYNLKVVYKESEKYIRCLLEETEKSTEEEYKITVTLDKEPEEGEIKVLESEIFVAGNETAEEMETKYIKSEEIDNIVYEITEVAKYCCPLCEECLEDKESFLMHLSEHGSENIDIDSCLTTMLIKVPKFIDKPTISTCVVCKETFESKEEYKVHLDSHKKFICDQCGEAFVKKAYLDDHSEVHSTEKKHKCVYCGKRFQRRTVLIKHKKIHTHPRQCICEVCGKRFNDKGTLKTHIMLVHVKERKFSCHLCNKTFPLKATLEKHIKRHVDRSRDYACTHCSMAYRDKSSLNRHFYVKHSNQMVLFACECGKQYTTSVNLEKHKKRNHAEDIDIDQQCDKR